MSKRKNVRILHLEQDSSFQVKTLNYRNSEILFTNSIYSETVLRVVTRIPFTDSSTNRIAQCGVRCVFLYLADCQGSYQRGFISQESVSKIGYQKIKIRPPLFRLMESLRNIASLKKFKFLHQFSKTTRSCFALNTEHQYLTVTVQYGLRGVVPCTNF